MLYSHFTQNCIFCTFWRLKILVLWGKIVENLLIFVYLFCPKNGAIDFTKTFITQEWLVVESCPTPRWIAFLMLYRLVYNIRSHFNELILAWSAYLKTSSVQHLLSFKTFWRHNCKTSSWRFFEDLFKTTWRRRFEVLKTFVEDLLQTRLEDVLENKDVCLGETGYNKEFNASCQSTYQRLICFCFVEA